MEKEELTKIGGAWKKVSANGNPYISGSLNNGKYFKLFVNTRKVEGSNQPDYQLMMSVSDAEEMGLKYEPKE